MTYSFPEDDAAVAPDPLPNETTPFRFAPDEDATGLDSDDEAPVPASSDGIQFAGPPNEGPDANPDDDPQAYSDLDDEDATFSS